MGVFVAGVPSSLAPRTPFFSRSPSPSPFTPAMQARIDRGRNYEKLWRFEQFGRLWHRYALIVGRISPVRFIYLLITKLGRLQIRIITKVFTGVRHEMFDAVCVTR